MEFLATPWGFGSVSIAAITLLLIVWRVGTISLSKAGFHIGPKGQPVKVSPHSVCPHAGDIMTLIHRTTEYLEKKQEIKQQLLEEQMRFYEETEEEIMGYLKKLFLKLLFARAESGSSSVQHPEYMAYAVTLKAVAAELKPYVRNCFKANHFAELAPEDQKKYIIKRREVVIQKTTELLNLYWRGVVVSRADMYGIHSDNIGTLEGYIEEVFDRAFSLARDHTRKIEEMDRSYHLYIANTLGADACSIIGDK